MKPKEKLVQLAPRLTSREVEALKKVTGCRMASTAAAVAIRQVLRKEVGA